MPTQEHVIIYRSRSGQFCTKGHYFMELWDLL